jgi:hypothetical protein
MVEKIGLTTHRIDRLDQDEFDSQPPSKKRYYGDGFHSGGCALYSRNNEILRARCEAWRADRRNDPLMIRAILWIGRVAQRIAARFSGNEACDDSALPVPHVLRDEFPGGNFFDINRVSYHLRELDAGVHEVVQVLDIIRAEYRPGHIYDERALNADVVAFLARTFAGARIRWLGWRPRYVVDITEDHLKELRAIDDHMASTIGGMGRRVPLNTYMNTVARVYVAGQPRLRSYQVPALGRGVFR